MISKGFQDALTELEIIADEPCFCRSSDDICKSCLAQEELLNLYQEIILSLERVKG